MSETSEWRQLTEAAAKRAREGIADAALAGDLQRVHALSSALRPLEDALNALLKARKAWQGQIAEIEALTQSDHTKAPQTKLRITLDWAVTGFPRALEVIAQPKAAESIAQCLASLAKEYGSPCLAKLTAIRVGKAGLVSPTPAKEFINPSTGAVYGHYPSAPPAGLSTPALPPRQKRITSGKPPLCWASRPVLCASKSSPNKSTP